MFDRLDYQFSRNNRHEADPDLFLKLAGLRFGDPHERFYIVEIRHSRIVGVIKDDSGYGWWAQDWVAVPDR
ncbi:hypothetical protein [Streptosporangium sp. NPDC087985]|uniref:hypothetical protein n=1 Tax=Streptosporangium sp. NPDC087985 TaxID=3366196 RepID=UPI003805D802